MSSLIQELRSCLSDDLFEGAESVDDPCDLYAFNAQLLAIDKKYVDPDDTDGKANRYGAALSQFIAANETCQIMNKALPDRDSVFSANLPHSVKYVVWEAQAFLAELLEENHGGASYARVLSRMQHGPGASCGSKGANSFFEKVALNSRTASSPFIRTLVDQSIKTYPLWASTETIRCLVSGNRDNETAKARFTTVPKNMNIDRGITVIPSDDMLVQLGVKELLQDYLRRTHIDIEKQQTLNRHFAYLGSAGIAPYCTIDLHAASDYLSIGLVRLLLPPSWYAMLMSLRTPLVEIPAGKETHVTALHMFGTMGNGFTFPLQTLIYTALVVACYRLLNVPLHEKERYLEDYGTYSQRFTVFGDDIIVDRRAYTLLLEALKHLGLLVNDTKSYCDGPFRESCGADWYNGVDVRPVYITSLESIQDRLSAFNRLFYWSVKHQVILRKTLSCLYSSLPRADRYVVPLWEDDTAGLRLPEFMIDKLRLGYKPSRSPSELLRSEFGLQRGSWLYMRHEARSVMKNAWLLARSASKQCDLREALGSAQLLSILHGSLRNGRVSLRAERVRYTSLYGIAPGWGCAAQIPGATAQDGRELDLDIHALLTLASHVCSDMHAA